MSFPYWYEGPKLKSSQQKKARKDQRKQGGEEETKGGVAEGEAGGVARMSFSPTLFLNKVPQTK